MLENIHSSACGGFIHSVLGLSAYVMWKNEKTWLCLSGAPGYAVMLLAIPWVKKAAVIFALQLKLDPPVCHGAFCSVFLELHHIFHQKDLAGADFLIGQLFFTAQLINILIGNSQYFLHVAGAEYGVVFDGMQLNAPIMKRRQEKIT